MGTEAWALELSTAKLIDKWNLLQPADTCCRYHCAVDAANDGVGRGRRCTQQDGQAELPPPGSVAQG